MYNPCRREGLTLCGCVVVWVWVAASSGQLDFSTPLGRCVHIYLHVYTHISYISIYIVYVYHTL